MTTAWDWDDIGYPNSLDVRDICHTIRHGYGGGYAASRPAAQKMQKYFVLTYTTMPSANWLNLIEFWRSVYGSANAFYFEFPVSLYGSPSYGGLNIGDPADGFDTDQEVYYGCGPVFTVRFAENELLQKADARYPGRWQVVVPMFEVV